MGRAQYPFVVGMFGGPPRAVFRDQHGDQATHCAQCHLASSHTTIVRYIAHNRSTV